LFHNGLLLQTPQRLVALSGASAHHEMQNQRDHREHQQQVDQTSCCMEHSESADPSYQQNHE
jgi:hypothetical protein